MKFPFCSLFLRKTKEYMDNTSIHGLPYVTQQGRHFTERLFWTASCIGAFYCTYSLLSASWYNFQHSAVSFGLDTAYLDWDTNFPAISICELESMDKIYEYGNKLFGKVRDMNTDFFLKDVTFFEGSCTSCSICGVSLDCPEKFDYYVQMVRSNCSAMLVKCTWNNEPFDCCSNFLPVYTEIGVCYTANSIHTPKRKGQQKFISNYKTGPGRLDVYAVEAIKVFLHSSEDVPFINQDHDQRKYLRWGESYTMQFATIEIDNDPALTETSVEQRNCRFPEENTLSLYKYYSYSGCIVECRARKMVELCNCTHHLLPKLPGVPVCGLKGLLCISQSSGILTGIQNHVSGIKKGLKCSCMSSCTEPEFRVIGKEKRLPDLPGELVSIIMDTLPNQRFRRNVVRSRLDLVVSMGGTAGLFLGASLLSTFEVVYFIFLRRNLIQKVKESKENAMSVLVKPLSPQQHRS